MFNSQNTPVLCELLYKQLDQTLMYKTQLNCILLEIQNPDIYTYQTILHTNHSTCSNTISSIISHYIKEEQKSKLSEWTIFRVPE